MPLHSAGIYSNVLRINVKDNDLATYSGISRRLRNSASQRISRKSSFSFGLIPFGVS